MRPWPLAIAGVLLTVCAVGADEAVRFLHTPNDTGVAETAAVGGVDDDNPFFQSLGTNGRACVTCHRADDGWSITPRTARERFRATRGNDPLFRPNDGAVSPLASISTESARLAAYRLLLERGLIRVGLPVPDGAEYTLEAVDDPYGYASASELSLFRRPLPSANLAFLSTVMWDGRETFSGETIHFDLAHQANGATVGHAQASRPLTEAERAAIVDFETSLFNAQIVVRGVGRLDADDATGGAAALTRQPYFHGINDPRGGGFDPRVFRLFDAWAASTRGATRDRRAIVRGQEIFNTRAFGPRRSTCSGCHNAPHAGSSSTALMFDIGVSAEARRAADVPLYTLRCRASGAVVRTTDPGLALISGRCADIGRFKVPTLRGLAARAPYFHDGSAATLDAVVDFYDARFAIGITDDEKRDLVAFLEAL
jgi:hypothetical protein